MCELFSYVCVTQVSVCVIVKRDAGHNRLEVSKGLYVYVRACLSAYAHTRLRPLKPDGEHTARREI